MNREIYKVFATQIVTSTQNPQGAISDLPNYPKTFDSRTYKATEANPNGDRDVALLAAQADFKAECLTLTTADNPTRVGWTVFIIRTSDGERIDRMAFGGYPDMTPIPPESEEEPEEQEQGDGE